MNNTLKVTTPTDREARDGAHSSGMEQGVAISYDRLDELLASRVAHQGSSVET